MWRITSDLLLGFFDRYFDRSSGSVRTSAVGFPDTGDLEILIGPP
jgi:hypothetical protein